jgi:hypothetical protein
LLALTFTGCATPATPATVVTNPAPTVANVYTAAGTSPAQIYVTPGNSTSVGNAAVTPANTITLTGSNEISALAVDSSGNIYASTATDIREFSATATGLVPPIRAIPFDSNTTLNYSFSIAVDSAGNIYASQESSGTILVFSASANGSV